MMKQSVQELDIGGVRNPDTIYRPVPGYVDLYSGLDGSIVQGGVGLLDQKEHRGSRGPKTPGYSYVRVSGKTLKAHQLVAAAFLGLCPPGLEIRHTDGPQGHPYSPENTYVYFDGEYEKRHCRTCRKRVWRERDAKRKLARMNVKRSDQQQ